MTTKYTTVTVSGYNSSPPSDDGSATESNKLKWSNHITKIGNPLKTAVELMDTRLVAALTPTASYIPLNYTTVASDHDTALICSSGVTVSLGDAVTMGEGYRVTIVNSGVTEVIVARANVANTINGVAKNVLLSLNRSATFVVANFNYFVTSITNTYLDPLDPSKRLLFNISSFPTATAGTITVTADTTLAGAGSDTVVGPVRFGTTAETLDGSSTSVAITPGGFAGNKSLAADGYYKLPGGLILQWGIMTTTTSTTAETFPIAFTTLYNVQVTLLGGASTNSPRVTTASTTGFSAIADPGVVVQLYWQAIGV